MSRGLSFVYIVCSPAPQTQGECLAGSARALLGIPFGCRVQHHANNIMQNHGPACPPTRPPVQTHFPACTCSQSPSASAGELRKASSILRTSTWSCLCLPSTHVDTHPRSHRPTCILTCPQGSCARLPATCSPPPLWLPSQPPTPVNIVPYTHFIPTRRRAAQGVQHCAHPHLEHPGLCRAADTPPARASFPPAGQLRKASSIVRTSTWSTLDSLGQLVHQMFPPLCMRPPSAGAAGGGEGATAPVLVTAEVGRRFA